MASSVVVWLPVAVFVNMYFGENGTFRWDDISIFYWNKNDGFYVKNKDNNKKWGHAA